MSSKFPSLVLQENDENEMFIIHQMFFQLTNIPRMHGIDIENSKVDLQIFSVKLSGTNFSGLFLTLLTVFLYR
jgi:hypothetical protein